MSDSVVFKLKVPFVSPHNKQTIETVTLRQPMVAEDFLIGAKAGENELVPTIIARLAGLTRVEVGLIAYSDYKKIVGPILRDLNDEDAGPGKD